MKFSRLAAFLLIALVCVVTTLQGRAQQTIQLQPFLSGLGSPIYVTNAKDNSNRIFYVEQSGLIRVVQPGSTTPTDFINISSKLTSGGEQGLLGLAFHPQFAVNRKFYVNYTCSTANNPACVTTGDTIISEFTGSASNPNQGDPASERVLLKIPQPFGNHNGGMIEFGPDGYLHIGMGDGGSGNDPGNRAQNRALLLGKMLRIDVTPSGQNAYTIPPSNPFVGANTARCDNGSTTSGGTCQEIYAIGMRNPFRWSFDRQSGQLFAGDVGQGAIEEVDIIQSGKNYGWRVYEGNQCTGIDSAKCVGGATPIVQEPPISQYSHTAGRCSITGGYVYRGRRGTFPQGAYIYGDYCTGEIWMLRNIGGTWTSTLLLDTNRNISSFGEDEAGEIYVCGISSSTVEKLVNPNAVALRNNVADFDGDGKTDISVVRNAGSNFTWYIQASSTGFRAVPFGLSGDNLTPANFDGDGKTDIAVWRSGTGDWYSLSSITGTFRAFNWGPPASGTITLPADYDGDGKDDYSVWSNQNWFTFNSATNTIRADYFGDAADLFAPADYDGDGKADLAVFRSSQGRWYIQRSQGGFAGIAWGAPGDIPVPGDYDGDGKIDVAVFRPGTVNGNPAFWYVLQSSNNQLYARQWGVGGDVPVPGDYDGDGKTDVAVTRNASGGKNWYILRSFSNTVQSAAFGLSTDSAIPRIDNP